MTDDNRARFDAQAEAWAGYNRQPLGRIRGEVTWHNLRPHLPPITGVGDPPRVLDAGGGSGELALRLVQRGYRVWLLDSAPGMLDQARQAAQGLPPQARARLTCCLAAAEEAGTAFEPDFFDAITCHTLIEYLTEPQGALQELVRLLRPGGLLSLSFVNRHAEVLRQVWSRGDPDSALARLAGEGFWARLFDIQGQAYTAEEASGWLAGLGLTVTAIYGVRAFADQVPAEQLEDPRFLEALIRLERAVAVLSPYRDIARYVHLVACKEPG
jgi:S-adenosylmethionine-dependent methyltransferase